MAKNKLKVALKAMEYWAEVAEPDTEDISYEEHNILLELIEKLRKHING